MRPGRLVTQLLLSTLVSLSAETQAIDWRPLFRDSFRFLTIENGFRYATEEATRSPHLPFFRGYADSVTNLHGWDDGNPLLDNYIGHPMQGAVSGFLWTRHDLRYRHVEFGRDPEYWKSRLRAGAFMWAYSEQLEIGPISEASIGNIQAKPPEQGFVDHVITPTLGLVWLIGEDAIDRYLIRHFEQRIQSRPWRAILRGTLNPTRSFANVLGGRYPWARPTDEYNLYRPRPLPPRARPNEAPKPGVPPFTLSITTFAQKDCLGGGANAAFRLHPQWQIVGALTGCNQAKLQPNHSGGSMTFAAGPRWTPALDNRWRPYVQLLAGGNKVTEEILPRPRKGSPLSPLLFDAVGPALITEAGLDYRLNNALALRLISVGYTHAWAHRMPGFAAPQGWAWSTGVILQMGTW